MLDNLNLLLFVYGDYMLHNNLDNFLSTFNSIRYKISFLYIHSVSGSILYT